MKQVSVVVADDHQLFVEGLISVLKRTRKLNLEVAGHAADGKSLMKILPQHLPDILLLDLNLPDEDGLDLIPEIRKRYKDVRIIVLTMYDDPKLVKTARKRGAQGYVLKSCDREELLQALACVSEGECYYAEELASVNGRSRSDVNLQERVYVDKFVRKHHLTKRELEILQLIAQALSNKEIAGQLFISDQTVSVHRKNIMRKLGVSNTAGLVKVAYDNSLV